MKKIRAMARRLQNRGYATMARVAEHLARLSAGDESNAIVDAADKIPAVAGGGLVAADSVGGALGTVEVRLTKEADGWYLAS